MQLKNIFFFASLLSFLNDFSQDKVIYEKGKNEFFTGNYCAAIDDLLIAKKILSEKDINYFIAMSYLNLKEYKNSIPFFSMDLADNKNNLNSYIQRANSYKMCGNYKLALKDIEAVIKINKEYFIAYYEKGDLNFEMKNYKAAINDYSKALEINPGFEKALYRIGFCYLNLKDTAKACKSWKQIEDLDDFEGYEKAEAIIKRQINN